MKAALNHALCAWASSSKDRAQVIAVRCNAKENYYPRMAVGVGVSDIKCEGE